MRVGTGQVGYAGQRFSLQAAKRLLHVHNVQSVALRAEHNVLLVVPARGEDFVDATNVHIALLEQLGHFQRSSLAQTLFTADQRGGLEGGGNVIVAGENARRMGPTYVYYL